jgi:hypothetical protein
MRKFYFKLGAISAVIGGTLAGTSALAVYFDLPAGAVASTTAYIGNLFTDLGPFVWLALGLPLGFWVIRKTISLVAGRAR